MSDPTSDARSGGVSGFGSVPAFELPAAGGGSVRSWDYRGRRHLVIWLAGRAPDRHAREQLAAREAEIRAEGAELLVVLLGSIRQAERIGAEAGLRGPVLADADGRVHERLGALRPTLLVTDRNGAIYWRAPVPAGAPDIDEALSWLGYLNILEPECGTCVPAWPPELFTAEPPRT
jgi:peroxiredoxin